MGGANFAFEVNPHKEIVWLAFFERFDAAKKAWTGFNNYRCTAASSLYPKYFTIQQAKGNRVQINNEGTDEDQYRVAFSPVSGEGRNFTNSIRLKGRSSATIKIPRDLASLAGGLNIVVTSGSGPEMAKLLILKKSE